MTEHTSLRLHSSGGGAGVKSDKQNTKTQGAGFEKQSIRELNLQVQGGTQRGLSHDDEAKGSASKIPRTGDTQGVSVCFLSSSNLEGYCIFVEEAGGVDITRGAEKDENKKKYTKEKCKEKN